METAKTVLITGSTGMIGSHLVEHYQTLGHNVIGVARASASSRLHDQYDYLIRRMDLLDLPATQEVLKSVEPDIIIHMAAQAFNGNSWSQEHYTHLVNFNSTLNLLNAAREYSPKAQILLACSSAEYGLTEPGEPPLKEDRLLRPVTPYGVSKAATETLGYQYFANYGMAVYLPRLFIHVGTGHPPATAIQSFARQIALIAKGKMEPVLKVGRLDTARDFIDVRDGVAGMVLLLEKGRPGIPVNICNGEAWKIGDVLDALLQIANVDVSIEQDDSLLRHSDEAVLLGDQSRLLELGWQRQYSMQDTLQAVMDDWLARV